jgi:anti-sigma B factor antagonist
MVGFRDRATVVLAVAGEIDMGTVDDLRRALSEVLNDSPPRRLVVDLAEVGFLESTGIAALMAAYRSGRAQQSTVTLINRQPLPRRVLEISGVDKVLMSSGNQP